MRNDKGQFIDGTEGIPYRFTRETSIGNQHAKGNPKNATTFGVIDNRMEKHQQWKGGIYKTRDCNMITYESRKCMPLGRWTYMQAYGEIPKNYVVIHLDGDKFNDDISNLDCISRAENLKRNSRL